MNVLCIKEELCQMHATTGTIVPTMVLWCDLGFVPNSRGNKAEANLRPTNCDSKYFKNDNLKTYKKFYEVLCNIMCNTRKPVSYYLLIGCM